MDVKRRRRLEYAAIDQIERLSELTQIATGRLRSPLLKESKKLRTRLRSRFKAFDYPVDNLESVISDIVDFYEACRKFLQIVDEVLKGYSDPGSMSITLGNAVARLGDWETRLARMSRSLVRFRNFLTDKAAVEEKARRKGSPRQSGSRSKVNYKAGTGRRRVREAL